MLRTISILLLALNGFGALVGGLALILAPDGHIMHMPVSMLSHSPFSNFLIPGLLLFFIIGLGSLLSASMCILRAKAYPGWIIFSGTALLIWILVQVLMLQTIHALHIIYGGLGIALLLLGVFQWRAEVTAARN